MITHAMTLFQSTIRTTYNIGRKGEAVCSAILSPYYSTATKRHMNVAKVLVLPAAEHHPDMRQGSIFFIGQRQLFCVTQVLRFSLIQIFFTTVSRYTWDTGSTQLAGPTRP